jgi:LacI family gluconate utilization system Gnt-I transcriptional repressor
MTVSRALREPDKVSERLRRKVEAAVSQIGYLPNRLAGSLASNRSNVVGMVVPSILNSLFANTVQGISDVLRRNGYHLMLADSGYSLDEEEAIITAFLQQRVCGLVLHNTKHTPTVRQLVEKSGVPVVEVGNLSSSPLDMTVSYSNFEAAKAMTLHLARLGYRRIGFVSLPLQDNERSSERRRGYLAALDEIGCPADPRLVLEVSGGLASGAEAIARLMQADEKIDAVFFAGDVLAVGAVLECQRRGWAVPERVAVASFDDVDLLRHVIPAITTLRIPRYEIGRRSGEVLLDRVSGRSTEPVAFDLKFEIIQREST